MPLLRRAPLLFIESVELRALARRERIEPLLDEHRALLLRTVGRAERGQYSRSRSGIPKPRERGKQTPAMQSAPGRLCVRHANPPGLHCRATRARWFGCCLVTAGVILFCNARAAATTLSEAGKAARE